MGLEQAPRPSEIACYTFTTRRDGHDGVEIYVIAGCFGNRGQCEEFEELWIVSEEGHIQNKIIYLVLRVDLEGQKEVLGLWVAQTEERSSGYSC
jgi:hypothetical protein